MKRIHLVAFFACLLLGFTSCQKEKKMPRIGIAGISIECSTFSPATTDEAAFRVKEKEQRRKLRGSRYGGYNDATRGARLNQERAQIEEVTITENKTREDPDLDTKIFSSNWYAYIYYFFIIVMLIGSVQNIV